MLKLTNSYNCGTLRTCIRSLSQTNVFGSQKHRSLNSNIPTERVSTPEKVCINRFDS